MLSIYLFWISVIFILYTYFGYPLIIWGLSMSRVKPQVEIKTAYDWPDISVVIPVYNEINNISKKIDNLLSINYPMERLRIILVSDGSDDGTVELYTNDIRIHFISYEERQGKPSALNVALKTVTTDIVIFTDVRQTLDEYAFKFLIKSLQQPGVGAVSGELCHQASETNIGQNVGLYWRYEKWIRKSESRFWSTAGVTGALYAIYTKDYHCLRKETLLDDFEVPMNIVRTNKRVLLESQAKIFDVSQENMAGEKNRKIRTLTGNFQSFLWNKWLFNPFKNPIFFQFLSHKVFRLVVPYAMLISLLSSFTAVGLLYSILFWSQVSFYFVGAMGIFSDKFKKNKLISVIVVFIELNISAVIALKQFLNGKISVRWDKIS